MYSHTTVGANDLARAKDFYDAVLAPLGLEVRYSGGGIIGWGLPGGRPQFLVVRPFDGGDPSVGNGSMIALLASEAKRGRCLLRGRHGAGRFERGPAGPAPAIPSQLLRRLFPRPRRQQDLHRSATSPE